MTLNQLTLFSLVAKYGNVTRAARELRISQSSASKQLRLLEEEFEAKLFKRGGPGVQLIEAGQVFLTLASGTLGSLQKFKATFKACLTAKSQRLAVGASYNASASSLPTLLRQFNESHPTVRLTLRTTRSSMLEEMVLGGKIEIAVVSHLPGSPDLASEHYRKERLVGLVPAKHPLSEKRKLSLQHLRLMPLIVRGGKEGRSAIERRLGNTGAGLNILMRCDSPVGLKAAVQEGIGIGILCEDPAYPEIRERNLKILSLPDGFENETYIIHHAERTLSASAQEFLALLRASRDRPRRIAGGNGLELRAS